MQAKKISIIAMLLIAAILVGFAAPTVLAAENPEVVVTVYVNAHDEDYIKNLQFDDGTTVGDYNYVIEYATKARDTSELTTYFDYVGWIDRDGVISLSLDPVDAVRNTYSSMQSAWTALEKPENGVSTDANWPTESANLQTLRWQYDCHWTFAKTKDYWNLEPSRTASNYLAVVMGECNP